MAELSDLQNMAGDIVAAALRLGAEHADASLTLGAVSECKVRGGEVELLSAARPALCRVRVFKGQRCTGGSTTELLLGNESGHHTIRALEPFLSRLLAAIPYVDDDPAIGLPAPTFLADGTAELGLVDADIDAVTPQVQIELAARCEAAAMDADERISASDGASHRMQRLTRVHANSHGFNSGFEETTQHLSIEVVADDADGKKRNGWWLSEGRTMAELERPEQVGAEASRRAIAQLGARKPESCKAPVIFDPIAGADILMLVFSVATGTAAYRRRTLFCDRVGEMIGSRHVTIWDDPTLAGKLGSRPYDGEGLTVARRAILDNGRFNGWLTSTYSARKLGIPPTGNAGPIASAIPTESASNLFMAAGDVGKDELLSAAGTGLLVQGLMGFGFNQANGDLSKGAYGVWYERGEPAYPVCEITISANLSDLLAGIEAVADDLVLNRAITTPHFLVREMTVAGR